MLQEIESKSIHPCFMCSMWCVEADSCCVYELEEIKSSDVQHTRSIDLGYRYCCGKRSLFITVFVYFIVIAPH